MKLTLYPGNVLKFLQQDQRLGSVSANLPVRYPHKFFQRTSLAVLPPVFAVQNWSAAISEDSQTVQLTILDSQLEQAVSSKFVSFSDEDLANYLNLNSNSNWTRVDVADYCCQENCWSRLKFLNEWSSLKRLRWRRRKARL